MRYGLTLPCAGDGGATWWTEYVYPERGGVEAMRERIRSGPVRSD